MIREVLELKDFTFCKAWFYLLLERGRRSDNIHLLDQKVKDIYISSWEFKNVTVYKHEPFLSP